MLTQFNPFTKTAPRISFGVWGESGFGKSGRISTNNRRANKQAKAAANSVYRGAKSSAGFKDGMRALHEELARIGYINGFNAIRTLARGLFK